MLDLHRLRLLRELKHRGTLAAVAEALAYTPSAISQQLSVLEAEAGVPLLERAGRRVRLTPAAERLVEHTEAILERLEQARADLDASAASIGGTVRVAAFHTTAHAVIPAALSALAAAHPALRVEVTEREPETSLPGLIAHEFDLALLEEYPGHPQRRRPELDYRQLATDPMRLAQPAGAAPARSRRPGRSPLDPGATRHRRPALGHRRLPRGRVRARRPLPEHRPVPASAPGPHRPRRRPPARPAAPRPGHPPQRAARLPGPPHLRHHQARRQPATRPGRRPASPGHRHPGQLRTMRSPQPNSTG